MINTSEIRFKIFGDGKTQQKLTNTVAKKMDKYIPAKDFELRKSAKIGKDKIVYQKPYAHYIYRGILYVDPKTGSPYAPKDTKKVPTSTPLTYRTGGSYWDKKMMAVEKDDIIEEVEGYIRSRK